MNKDEQMDHDLTDNKKMDHDLTDHKMDNDPTNIIKRTIT